MAMRLRRIDGILIAVCAAKAPAAPGDIYLDDEADHAIRRKIDRDMREEGLIDLPSSAHDAIAATVEGCDVFRTAGAEAAWVDFEHRAMAAAPEVKRMYAVVNHAAGEGLLFEDEKDAKKVASGRLGWEYPSIAEEFVDSYPDGNVMVPVDVPEPAGA
ncbi:MAG: hypothetical protein LDL44_03165 [Caenispirillum sp.]|nr:hypothetical protein [Caenispirillum sp.]